MKINTAQRVILFLAIFAWIGSLFAASDYGFDPIKLVFIWLAILGLTGLSMLAMKD